MRQKYFQDFPEYADLEFIGRESRHITAEEAVEIFTFRQIEFNISQGNKFHEFCADLDKDTGEIIFKLHGGKTQYEVICGNLHILKVIISQGAMNARRIIGKIEQIYEKGVQNKKPARG